MTLLALFLTAQCQEVGDSDFKETVAAHKYAMVLFYSNDCGHSRKALEYYAKVEEKLASENLKMPVLKIDVDRNPLTASEQGIKAVPSLKLFVKAYPISYQSANITPNAVYEWVAGVLANKFSDELRTLEDVKEIEELDIAVILYLPRGDVEQLEDFNHVAGSHESIPFYYTHNEKHAKHLGLESAYAFLILRRFDDGNKIFGGESPIAMGVMADFLKMFGTPLIEDLSQPLLDRYSDNMGVALVYFDSGRSAPQFEEFKRACFHRHTSVGCIFADKDLHDTVKFLEDLGVPPEEPRPLFLVHFRQPNSVFYKFQGEVAFEAVDAFVVGFFQKTIPRYYRSQLATTENKELKDLVKHITGRQFDEAVVEPPHAVLVLVRSDSCSSCGAWKPILQDMLVSFASQGGFTIVQIDGTKNEHPYLTYEAIPALLVYSKKDKSKPIEYKGNKDLEEFKAWLSTTLKVKLKTLNEQTEEAKRRKEGVAEAPEEDKFEEIDSVEEEL